MIIFLTFFPLVYVGAVQLAFKYKGCLDPSLSQKIAIRCIFVDCLFKILIYPLCDELDSYLIVTCGLSFIFFGCCVISIYWNLTKQNSRFSKKIPSNINFTNEGIRYLVVAFIFFGFNSLILIYGWQFEDIVQVYVVILISMLLYGIYVYLYFMEMIRWDKLKLPSLRSLAGLSAQQEPIVLIRSFKIDDTPSWNNKTIDEIICGSIDMENYPIISLANPDEILPTGGSIKIQAKDEYWKEVIKEVLSNCRAVLLIEGRSDGLHWEISKLKEYLNPNQLYVYIPPKKYRILAWCTDVGSGELGIYKNFPLIAFRLFDFHKHNKLLREVWQGFSALLNQMEFGVPKSFPGNNTLISFNDSWKAEYVMKVLNISEMWRYVTDKTGSKESNFNYRALADRIMAYEANEFLPPEKAELYLFQLKKLLKLSNAIIIFLIVSIVFVWILI